MKRTISVVFTMMLVLGFVLASSPKNVEAKSTINAVAGSWTYEGPKYFVGGVYTSVSAKVVAVNLAAPLLRTLESQGLALSSAAKICHEYGKTQFDWVGEIYQLKSGAWAKLTTTTAWVPATFKYMSCANATEAGTYALFGYYKDPALVAVQPNVTGVAGDWTFVGPKFYVNGVLVAVKAVDVYVDLSAAPVWGTQMYKGIQINSAAKICHSFGEAAHNWVAEIREFKSGKWVKVPSTTTYVKEVEYVTCANVTEAGTYAIFGLYQAP